MDETKPPPPTVSVKLDTLTGLGKHPTKDCDFTKCYYCGEELLSETPSTWLGTQTLLREFYCVLCNKKTSVKQFLTTEVVTDPETNTTNFITMTARFYTGWQNIKLTDVQCTTTKCNKFHTFRTIDQSEFINKEEIFCTWCKFEILFVQQSQCLIRNDARFQRKPKTKQAITSAANASKASLGHNRFSILADWNCPTTRPRRMDSLIPPSRRRRRRSVEKTHTLSQYRRAPV